MGKSGIATHEETLRLLSEAARNGSISAAIALERALRAAAKDREEDEVGDAIDQILQTKS